MTEKEVNYRRLSGELDEILARLQSGELDIDEAVKLYGRGMSIVKELEEYLKSAENKVSKIKKSFE
jgi:exodeoxyribonuclease VII small subunit